MAIEPTDSDYSYTEDGATNDWDTSWGKVARAFQGVRAIWNAVTKGGVSPADHVTAFEFGDGTTKNTYRLRGSAGGDFYIEHNTDTEGAPNWVVLFSFVAGGQVSTSLPLITTSTLTATGATSLQGIDNNAGGITDAGVISGVAGITLTSGNANLGGGDISNAGAFLGVVGGVTPVGASDLVTKAYVDAAISALDSKVHIEKVVMLNDTVHFVTNSEWGTTGQCQVWISDSSAAQEWGWWNCFWSPSSEACLKLSAGTDTDTGVVVPAGTTGTPGFVGVYTFRGNDGFYIENRAGSRVYDVFVSNGNF